MSSNGNESKYARDFLSYLSANHLSPVLSLTCGNAEDELYLARNGLTVCAVDNDLNKVNQVRSAFKAAGLTRMKVIKCNILEPLPFETHYFNSLYFKFGLHYFSQEQIRRIIIPEIIRLLKPGSLSSIIFRYIDVASVDLNKYEIKEFSEKKLTLMEKESQRIMTRFVLDEEPAKTLFAEKFSLLKSVKQWEDIPDRFSKIEGSTIISLLLKVR